MTMLRAVCIGCAEAALLSRRMRSLEAAAQAGVLIVGALAAIIAAEAARSGFPAIRSGELPLWGLKVRPRCLPACMLPLRTVASTPRLRDQSSSCSIVSVDPHVQSVFIHLSSVDHI